MPLSCTLSKLSLIPFSPRVYECKMCGEKLGDSLGDMQRQHTDRAALPDWLFCMVKIPYGVEIL
jgi:hypothetical protein